MKRLGAAPHLIVVAIVTLLVAWCQVSGVLWLRRAELIAQDSMTRRVTPAPLDPSLVFLAVDTTSAGLESAGDLDHFNLSEAGASSRRALELMVHEWPWSREVHGLVLDRLIGAGARVIVFDFTFPKPSPSDEAFGESLNRNKDRVVIAANITHGASNGERDVFTPTTPTLVPQTVPRDTRVAFDNFWPDMDDVIRNAQYRSAIESGVWESGEEYSIASRALQKAGLGALVPAGREEHRLRFAGPPGTFVPHSIHEIFVPAYWKGNYKSGEFFRDKIVVIGAHGNWQQDEHLTPLGVMPGPEVHLNAINNLLHPGFVRELVQLWNVALVVLFALLPAVIRRFVRRPYMRFLAIVFSSFAWIGVAFVVLDRAGVFLPAIAPLLAFNLNGASGLFLDIVLERREKARLRSTFERYVSRNVVNELIENSDRFARALGGELRPVTILFSDIRNFTRFAAEVDSRTLVAQLNEYFTGMVDCVFRHGGTLDKFIGDAVMAVWGNAHSAGPAGDARNAVACALAMREELERLNARWTASGKPALKIGIGLNSGEVIVGNIGSASRMEFTVIGDAVNMAWRLQEYTKRAGTDIVLGAAVVKLIGSEFPTGPLAPCVLDGGVVLECARPAETALVCA